MAISYIGGVLASLARLSVAAMDTRRAHLPVITLHDARVLERRFSASYFLFAVMLGLFAATAVAAREHEIDALAMTIVVGYCAGVASGISLRPKLAAASMVVAAVPTTLVLFFQGGELLTATAVFALALLAGGVRSVLQRHRMTAGDIDRRIAFSTLARQDDLTKLPNRLGLREYFSDRRLAVGSERCAIHCLDLDGFKPVNDRYGHPTGDKLLISAAKRLQGVLREGDIVARLGGDEFCVIQFNITSRLEAQNLAQRLTEVIAQPFHIDGRELMISTSIGYVLDDDADLDTMLIVADQALYDAKRLGNGMIASSAIDLHQRIDMEDGLIP